MKSERAARLLLFATVVGLPLTVLIVRWLPQSGTDHHRTVEIRGKMAEAGGWIPSELTAALGEPLHLRLTSDDVVHGFAVGGLTDPAAVDVKPGEVTETAITFSRPGKYVFYCTRWCGPDHWRMRGVIEVTGAVSEVEASRPPLYLSLGLDLDAPHPADVVPAGVPSAERAANLDVNLRGDLLSLDYYRSQSPLEIWRSLRTNPVTADLSDMAVWDLVALAWKQNTTPESLEIGKELYAANCAACHGESGAGDGVMASALAGDSLAEFGHTTTQPADFTDAQQMLGASPALLQGKIIRGGMGTGMPYWGPIFTEEQTWAIVDYLWTFQFRPGVQGRD